MILIVNFIVRKVFLMEYYAMNIAGVDRNLPICPVNDKLSIAAFVIFGDQELTVAAAGALLEKAPEYDYLITAEAKGIPLIHEMARQHGDAKYMLARKGPKLYMRDILEVEVDSITTVKKQKLYLDGYDAKLMEGKRILIVDDVISTGNSLAAIETLVTTAGETSLEEWRYLQRETLSEERILFILSLCLCLIPTER